LAKRRREARPRRTTSADLRFGFALVFVAAVLLVLGTVLAGQLREADWKGAAISGGLAAALLAISLYSIVQKRR
jgi:hypothetical protein